MGYTFSHHESKKDLTDELVWKYKNTSYNDTKYLDHSLVGNTLYIAIQYQSERKTEQSSVY